MIYREKIRWFLNSGIQVILLLLLFSSPSLGSTASLQKFTNSPCNLALETPDRIQVREFIEENIDPSFANRRYILNCCDSNVFYLVERISEAISEINEDLDSINVIYIVPIRGSLQPRNSNWNKLWRFHVVLEHNGRIFDFDYNGETGSAPTREYFKTMFPRIFQPPLGYRIKVIPAAEYLAKYPPQGGSKYGWEYFFKNDEDYPRFTLRKFLSQTN